MRKNSFFVKFAIVKVLIHINFVMQDIFLILEAREILLEKLDILGLDKNNFGLHSLRAGGATNAARLLKKPWEMEN
jgi:hypothetical protein